MTKICLSGYYGFDNMGNDAIMLSIITSLQKYLDAPEIIVLSDNPRKTRADYGIEAYDCWQWRSISKALHTCDVLILGGGNLLKDSSGTKFIRYYLKIIRMACRRKKPVFVFAQRIGPIESKKLQEATVQTLRKCAKVTVRDDESAALLAKWGFRRGRIRVTADPLFLLDDVEREWLQEDQPLHTEEVSAPVVQPVQSAANEPEETAILPPVNVVAAPPVTAPLPPVAPAATPGPVCEGLSLNNTSAHIAPPPVRQDKPTPPAPDTSDKPLVNIEIQVVDNASGATPQPQSEILAETTVIPSIGTVPEEDEANTPPAWKQARPAKKTPQPAAAHAVSEDTIRLNILRSNDSDNNTVKIEKSSEVQLTADSQTKPDAEKTNQNLAGKVHTSPVVNPCPTCGSGNKPGVRFCAHCGNPLPAPAKADSETVSQAAPVEKLKPCPAAKKKTKANAEKPNANKNKRAQPASPEKPATTTSGKNEKDEDEKKEIRCTNCGTINYSDTLFCSKCGYKLHAALVEGASLDRASAAVDDSYRIDAMTNENDTSLNMTTTDSTPQAPSLTDQGQGNTSAPPKNHKAETTAPAAKAEKAAAPQNDKRPHTTGVIGTAHPSTWKNEGDRIAAFCLRRKKGLPSDIMAELADMVAQAGYRILFLPFQYPEDIATGKEVMELMKEPAIQLDMLLNAKEMMTVFDHLDLVVSIRLHPLMMAAIDNVPFAALGGDAKIRDFTNSMGLEVLADLSNLNREELFANMQELLAHTDMVLETVNEHLSEMRERAEDNYTMLLNLLRRKRHG